MARLMECTGTAFLAGLCWIALTGPSVAGDASGACPPAAGERVRVAEVIDGDTLLLEDGRTLRLVSALAPKPGAGDDTARTAKLADAARAALARAADGRELALAITGQRPDRHGRLHAHAFVPSLIHISEPTRPY